MAKYPIRRIPLGCYVYHILVDGIIRYVGKGSGERVYDHIKVAEKINRGRVTSRKILRSTLYTRLARSIREDSTVTLIIVSEGLSDADAYNLEIEEIAARPIGSLWNDTRGGDGFTSEYQKKLWSDPDRIERHRQLALKAWQDNPERKGARFSEPGSREKQKEMMRAKWDDPEYRAAQKLARSKPRPSRQGRPMPALSAPAKERWANPDFRKRAIAAMKRANSDPQIKEKTQKSLAAAKSKPEYRAKLRDAALKRWSDPAFRERAVAAIKLRKSFV